MVTKLSFTLTFPWICLYVLLSLHCRGYQIIDLLHHCASSSWSSLLQLWTEEGPSFPMPTPSPHGVWDRREGLKFTVHQIPLFTILVQWTSVLRLTFCTGYHSRCLSYIDVFSHLSRSLAPDVQALHLQTPLFTSLFSVLGHGKLYCVGNVSFPTASHSKRRKRFYYRFLPNKSCLKRDELELSMDVFLTRSKKA